MSLTDLYRSYNNIDEMEDSAFSKLTNLIELGLMATIRSHYRPKGLAKLSTFTGSMLVAIKSNTSTANFCEGQPDRHIC